MNPLAKTNLLVEALPGETLVYDRDRHRAHRLDVAAAFLLKSSNGKRSVEELSVLSESGLTNGIPPEAVEIGLERLARARLVEWTRPDPPGERMTRKAALRRLALAGVVIPSVLTVVAPRAAQAVTLIPSSACGPANVGRCCTNKRICQQAGASHIYQCNGGPC